MSFYSKNSRYSKEIKIFFHTFSLIFILLFVSGCLSSKTPYTQRTQLMLISPDEELKLSNNAVKEILQSEKLSSDKVATSRVETIGKKLADVSNRDDFKWEFYLVDKDVVNAFCLPGGKIFVYSGLMDIVDSDDELSVVIAHEIAHAIARHGAERLSIQQASSALKSIGLMIVGTQTQNAAYLSAFDMAFGLGTTFGVALPYSRSHEYEADLIGLNLMYKAGYNIDFAITFWEKMQNISKDSPIFEFASTHPSNENRIQKLKEEIARLKTLSK